MVATVSTDDEVTSEIWNTMVAAVDDFASVIDGTYTDPLKFGPPTSRLAVGTTITSGEKGIQTAYDAGSVGGASTLASKNATTTYPLHINPIEVGTAANGSTTVFGHKIYTGASGGAMHYQVAISNRVTSNADFNGGLLVDVETLDASGSAEDNGSDTNALKIVHKSATTGSWNRGRALEIYVVKGNGSTTPNLAPWRGIDIKMKVAANLTTGNKPWHYAGMLIEASDYPGNFTGQQADCGVYVAGRVDPDVTNLPGWKLGFAHDLKQPSVGVTPDYAFYTDYNGDVYAKRRLGVGVVPTNILDLQTGVAGAQYLKMFHADTGTATSHAGLWLQTNGSGGGDPYIRFTINGVADVWALGSDNSDSDAFVLSPAATLGGTNYFKVTTAGVVTLGPSLGVTINGTGIGVGVAPTEALHMVSATAGTPINALIRHTDNTNANSHASAWYRVGGASGGSAYMRFTVDGATDWSVGLQNDASDAFKITASSSPGAGGGSSDCLVISTGGNIVLGRAATNIGFYGGSGAAKGTITGSRGSNAALASLLTFLASTGLLTDSTS